MSQKSDNSPELISATEVSRTFSAILDRVERGDRFVVERHGKRVCLLAPPPADGRPASECLARLRDRAPVTLDDAFGEDLLDVIAGESTDGRPWDC